MSMSKKDFEAIASAFKAEHTYAKKYGVQPSLEVLSARLATYFQQCNPRFDDSKFIIACMGD